MKDPFNILYWLVIGLIVVGCFFLYLSLEERKDDCLSKSCKVGAPFYDADTGNCFCAEVPK